LPTAVDRLPYRADTNALTIEAGQGFNGLAGPVYQPIAELFVVDMLLAKPLASRGETATLEYSCSFHYAAPPPPEFPPDSAILRREPRYPHRISSGKAAGQGRMGGVGTAWTDPSWNANPSPWTVSFAVHRYLRLAEKTAVGFHWDW